MAKAFQNKLLAVKIGLLEKQRSNLQNVASATDKVLSLANDWTRNADAGSDATFKDLNCMIEDMILYLGDKYTELPAFCANASDSTGGLFGGGSQVNTGGLFGGTSQVNTGGLFGGTSQVNTVFRTPTGQIGSNPFETCTRASTSQFGQPHAIGWVSAVEGTPIPLDPPYGQDVCVKNGVKIDVNTKHQCITAMMEYGNKSLEELRLEDYNIDQKSKQSMGLFGQTPSTQVTTGFSTGDGPGECLCAACQRGNSRWNKNASSIIYTSTVSFGSELTGIKEFNTKKNETICCPIMNLEKVNKQKKKKKNLKKMYVQTKKKISNKMQQKQPKKEKHFEKSQCLDNYLHKALQTATRIAKKAHIGLKDNNHLMQKKIAEQKETNDDHEKQLEEINVALDNILESIQVLTTRVGLLESKVVDNKQFSDVHTKCEILQENSENVQCNLDDPDTQFQELASKADEASKNLMPIPELKNLQNAEDKINAFQEEWKKSKQEVGKLHNDFEIENPRGEDPDFSPSSGENCDF